MEELPKNIILRFHDNTLEAARKDIGLDDTERLKDAIGLLEDWIKKQAHFLKKDFTIGYLERTLLTTKGSVERAKQTMDKLFTLKTLMPEYFSDDLIHKNIFDYNSPIVHAHLPKLMTNHHRVYLVKFTNDNIENQSFRNYYRYLVVLSEYLKKYDYSSGYFIVSDFRDVKNIVNLMTKINPAELRDIMTLMIEGYGMRIKGIHIITESKMVDAIITLFKQVVSDKIAGRIHVHKDLTALYEFVPKDVLPVEYGGQEIPLKDIYENWVKTLSSKENLDYFKEMCETKINEAYRQTDKFNENYASIPGSFRSLKLD